MNIIAIIPSRMGSKRLPGKPMADIHGVPMIGHVYKRVSMCNDLHEVYIATCDKEIAEYAETINAKTIMTSAEHLRSTDRVAEALRKIEDDEKRTFDIVVMIQGDEPLVTPDMIANTISPLIIDPSIEIVSLMTEVRNEEEANNPNSVKVVCDINNFALYMSRSPIPFQNRGIAGLPVLKKVNVVAMRRGFLFYYSSLPPSPLELVEGIGPLRVLEQGGRIKMVLSETYTVSVDTKEDLELVRKMMKDDYWFGKYKEQ